MGKIDYICSGHFGFRVLYFEVVTRGGDDMEGVGERIKKARKEQKLTQAQLGARCGGMADSAIRRYESGRGNPTLETLQRIADALDIPVGELLGTIPQPDREYERVCDTLNDAGLCIESAGGSRGPDADGDIFYVWHKDSEDPTADRVEYAFYDLLRIIDSASSDAEQKRKMYLQKRLDAELF